MKNKMRKFDEGGSVEDGISRGAMAGLGNRMGKKSAKDLFLESLAAKPNVPLPSEGHERKTENQALKKVKDIASGVISSINESDAAKGLRNYGRMYKQGLGMKPETQYEYKKGGKVSSASKRADGIAIKGKTKGRIV